MDPQSGRSPDLVLCAACKGVVGSAVLEAHVRSDLDYPTWRCRICHIKFFSAAAALLHFQGPLSRHPGVDVDIVETSDWAGELKVEKMIATSKPLFRNAPLKEEAAALEAPSEEDVARPEYAVAKPPTPLETLASAFVSPSAAFDAMKVERLKPIKVGALGPGLDRTTFAHPGRPFVCLSCAAGVSASHVNNHLSRQHLGRPAAACRHCAFSVRIWYFKLRLERHLMDAHKLFAAPKEGIDFVDNTQFLLPKLRDLKRKLIKRA